MKIRHLNHSCLLIDVADQRILVDPGGFSVDQVRQAPGLDAVSAVAITHQHPDHVNPELLGWVLEQNPGMGVIVEPETADLLAAEGVDLSGHTVVPLAAGTDHQLGPVTISGVGGKHAIIHPDIACIGNTGLVITADGEPRLGVTGDSLEPVAEFQGIDALAFAVVAPWSKMSETIDFLRAVRPKVALPVHDAVASAAGRAIYLRQSTDLALKGTEVRDWPGAERTVELTG